MKTTSGATHSASRIGFAVSLSIAITLSAAQASFAADSAEDVAKRTGANHPALKFVGDYEGVFNTRNGKKIPLVAQVIALGKGRFCARILPEFDQRVATTATLIGHMAENKESVDFFGWGDVSDYCGPDWEGVLEDGKLKGTVSSRHGGKFEFKKVVRLSPTYNAKPPAGAVVLFDGGSMDKWEIGRRGKPPAKVEKKRDGDAFLTNPGGTIGTKDRFTYFKLHVEFRTPFMPEQREQSRGNSGVHLHGREIQVLDSYGLGGRSKECGGIYARIAPRVNMCAPPMQWQTYDVVVHEPGADGKSWMEVKHNGVTVLERVELGGELKPTDLRLQDHGNPVAYRNIWLVETP